MHGCGDDVGSEAHVKRLLLRHAPHQVRDGDAFDFVVNGDFIADQALEGALEVRVDALARLDVAE